MINVGKNTRLTDELERQLMQQAIEEQLRFKPAVSFKKLYSKLAALVGSTKTVSHTTVNSVS
ncbi:MAG TPA: hypothetical protein VL001_01450 [Candidimonas sp.]|nr:hypothetical protein [Candidimonas sp.]